MRANEREREREKQDFFAGCTAIVNPLGSFASFEIILMRECIALQHMLNFPKKLAMLP